MKSKTIGIIIIVAVVAAGLGFWGGKVYGVSHASSDARGTFASGQFRQGQNGQMRNGQGRGGFSGLINGQIISKDDSSITVQLPNNGGTKIVLLSGSVQVLKSTQGSASDLSKGIQVSVTGTANADGSVTANVIQIRPNIGSSTPR